MSIADDKSVMQEILFTNVKQVYYDHMKGRVGIVTIEMVTQDEDQLSFYADSSVSVSSIVWCDYCKFLHTIPYYAIPEVPQEDFLLQQSIEQYKDPRMFNAGTLYCIITLCDCLSQ